MVLKHPLKNCACIILLCLDNPYMLIRRRKEFYHGAGRLIRWVVTFYDCVEDLVNEADRRTCLGQDHISSNDPTDHATVE